MQHLFVDFRRPFEVSSRILRAVGLWSSSPDSFFGLNFYTVYAVSILAVCNVQYAFELAYWLLTPGDFEAMASSGVVLFAKLETNVKAFCIIRHQPTVKRFMRECNKGMFQPKTRLQAEKAEGVLRVHRLFYLSFGVSAICSVSGMVFSALIGRREEAALPYVAWYPYNHTRHFKATYCHQVLSSFLMGQTHVNVDCFAVGLVAFVIAQCDILADSVRNLKAIARGMLEVPGRRVAVVDQTELMVETEKQFYACIRHHKEILRWFREIYNMLSLLMVTQYAVSALTLCMTMIQASLTDPSDPKFTAMAMYAAVMSGQLFLFCWWGDQVISKSSRIPAAAFESDWFEMSPGTKKDLLTFVHCTQTPMELFGADYFKVSLGNFLLILKHSYSFFAVLRRMNS